MPPEEGHPHTITQKDLEKWIGQKGHITELNGVNGCYGKAFYGVFTL